VVANCQRYSLFSPVNERSFLAAEEAVRMVWPRILDTELSEPSWSKILVTLDSREETGSRKRHPFVLLNQTMTAKLSVHRTRFNFNVCGCARLLKDVREKKESYKIGSPRNKVLDADESCERKSTTTMCYSIGLPTLVQSSGKAKGVVFFNVRHAYM
jgi:hypothetical protein